ncbi:MAG: GIY-YIG nuclease family protein [Candidatus Bathyarchaeota archaeon]|nr:GIY-YIG nuclease family protein [Candidatus Bathyarchaeota archaeon]
MVSKGTYCLCINVADEQIIKVGALRDIAFPEGRYIYVGSAPNSLIPRIERHMKTSKGEHDVTHWHVDYLLREPSVSIEAIYATSNGERMECTLADKVSMHGEPVPRFGCSDCKCNSHLFKVEEFRFLEKMGLRKYP